MTKGTRELIREFSTAFGRPVNTRAVELSVEDRLLLGKLIVEETLEYVTKGLGLTLWDDQGDELVELDADAIILTHEGLPYDPIESADGLGDIEVVAHFNAHWHGFNLDAVLREVHDSNMSKLDEDGNPLINRCAGKPFHDDPIPEDCSDVNHLWDPRQPVGKILKGPNFRKPDLAKVIALGNRKPWGLNPQIRFAVERALARAQSSLDSARTTQEELGMVTLQGVAWADEVESLEEAVEVLKGLE